MFSRQKSDDKVCMVPLLVSECLPTEIQNQEIVNNKNKLMKKNKISVIYNFCMHTFSSHGENIEGCTILEGCMCLDIFVCIGTSFSSLAAGEKANIWLLIFIQNVSHDLSVDDNLLLKKNVL